MSLFPASREALLFTRARAASAPRRRGGGFHVMRSGAVLITFILFGSGAPLMAQATKPAAPAVGAADVAVGAKIEVKWGGLWRAAVVKNHGNGWVLVNYLPGISM